MKNFEDVEIISGIPESTPNELLAQGKAIQKIETGYHTAVAVQKPRNLDKIVNALDIESQYGGEDFYYSWTVKNKKTGRQDTVEGCSVGAALAIAREFGNCAIPVEINETADSFIFTASFIDIEKGFTVTRVYRHKKRAAVGKYNQDRYDDMEFQKGQSKAIRNVVLAGVPKWLSSRVMRKAKEAVISGIGKEGLDVAKDKAVKFLKGYNISKESIENVLGKTYAEWNANDVATLRPMCKQILDGESSAESLFPPVEQEKTTKKDEKTTGELSPAALALIDQIDQLESADAVDKWRSGAANRKKIDALGAEAEKVYQYAETAYQALKGNKDGRANK